MKKPLKTTKTEFNLVGYNATIDDIIESLVKIKEETGSGKHIIQINAVNVSRLEENDCNLEIDSVEFDSACYQCWINARPQ